MLANRRDSNEKGLDAVFLAYGFHIEDSSRVGPSKAIPGFPDRIISKSYVIVLVEYKSEKPKKAELPSLNDKEQKFFDRFPGPKEIVWDVDSAIRVCEKYCQEQLWPKF